MDSQRNTLSGAVVLLLATLAWSVLTPHVAQAQGRRSARNSPRVARVLMLAPREYQQQLKEAERALAEKQFSEAIEHIGRLLHTSNAAPSGVDQVAEDFFVGRPGENHYQSSLRAQARRLLGSMPSEGRELYELQFGAEARRTLKEALAEADLGQLSDVSRMYFHTKAGYTATMLLGRIYLDMSRPLAAAMCFSRLADTQDAVRRYDPELSLMLALSWRMAGMNEKAGEVLTELRRRNPTAEFVMHGNRVRIFQDDEDPIAWLDQTVNPPTQSGSRLANEWHMHRGVPSRNAESDGSLPLLRARWRVQIANDPDDEERIRSLIATNREEGVAAIPAISPLIVDDVVLMKTTDNMMAVEFSTGKRVWEYPWSEPLSSSLNEDEAPVPTGDTRRKQLEERLWLDAIYGQMASDGKTLFLVDDLGYTQQAAAGLRIQMFRGMPIQNPNQPKEYNSLVALDVATEGKYRWRVGGVNGEDEPALAGAFFLGPPLVLAEDLYVLAEIRGDISLFVLDANNGHVRWSQQLAHVGQVNILGDPVRRLAGATPSFSDGVLICPTSGGAVVAIDIPNRSLLWGYQYKRNFITFTRNGIRVNGVYSGSNASRESWVDASCTIADGRVLITPAEADELHCLDLLTGEPVWKAKRRHDSLYIGCVHEGKVVVIGKQAVTAWKLADGTQAWQLEISSDQETASASVPTGRGFLSDHHYYLPTSYKLMQIDVRDGSLVEAVRTAEPLGNLLSYRDHIVSLGPDYLTAFYRVDRLQQLVDGRLQQNPRDPWAVEQLGLLLLDGGNRDAALRSLRDAFNLYGPQDDRREGTKTILIDTLLDALEDDFEANGLLAAEVDELIDRPLQREKYLRLMGKGLLEAGKAKEAFEAFLELAFHQSENASRYQSVSLPLLENGSRDHLVRRDRFVRSGIRESLRLASSEERQLMVAAIDQRLNKAAAADSAGPLKQLLRIFADHHSAARLRFELARRYLDTGELLNAELVLAPLLESQPSEIAAPAWALMARVMEQARQSVVAARCYEQLRRWPDEPCLDGRTAAELIADIPVDSEIAAHLAGLSRWPYGEVKVERVKATATNLPTRFQPYANFRPIRVLETSGPIDPEILVEFDATGANAIVVKDTLGQEQMRISGTGSRIRRFSDNTLTCKSLGHLLLVNVGQGILAANVLQAGLSQEKRVVWPDSYNDLLTANANRRDIHGQASVSTNAWGQRLVSVRGRRIHAIGPVSYDGITYQQGNRLICVDPLTGHTLWIRHDVSPQSTIWGDSEFIFVSSQDNNARVFRLLDGQEVGTRKVPDPTRRWATEGRAILTWTDENHDGKSVWMLRLYDPWREEDIWRFPVDAYARGYVSRQGQIAIVERNGQFTLLDAKTGRTLIQQPLEPSENRPSEIYLLPSDDQYVLVVGHRPRSVKGVTITSFPDSTLAPLIDGHIYAFDRATGSAQWQVPAVIESFGLPLNQPPNLPILAFVRQVFRTDRRTSPRPHLSLLCIDKRDGRIVVDADNLNFSYGSFLMMGNDADKSVTLQLLNVHNYRLEFSHDPQPPEPPAQTGSAASRPKGAGLSNIVGAFFGAIGKQVQRQGQRTEKEVKKLIERQKEGKPIVKDQAPK